MKVIGFENPNSYVKVCAGQEPKVYRNTLSRPPRERFQGSGQTVYTVNGESYIVGKARDYETSSSKGTERYNTSNFYKEGVIALSQYAEDGDKVVAVTGLPAKHYTDHFKKKIKSVFQRRHVVEVNGIRKEFEVADVRTLLQPMGTFIYSCRDRRGVWRPNYQQILSGKVLVPDIGFGTTDYGVFVEGDLYDWGEASFAMRDVYADIWRRMAERNREKDIATAKEELFNLENQLRQGDYFTFSGESYYVGDIKQDIYALYADKIIASLSNKVDMKEFDYVVFAGGGVLALERYLKDHLINKNSVSVVEPQTSNVEGFYVFGRYFLEG